MAATINPQKQKHFLVVTYPAQGHINPAVHLATRLASTTGARITFSTSISAHRKMFPRLASPDQELTDGLITYLPISDGYDQGFDRRVHDAAHFMLQYKTLGSRSLSAAIHTLDSRGRPVDCVIYTFLASWAADVARAHGVRSAQYWIQPATVFAIYHHAFRGYDSLIAEQCGDPSSTVELPGLPPLQVRDLPSFLITTSSPADDPYASVLTALKEAFSSINIGLSDRKHKPKVLVNTFDELEADALSAVKDLELIAVGPILQSFPKDNKMIKASSAGFDLFKPDEKAYMAWLDSKPEKSVVYVSFGSMAVLKQEQMEEISKGLKASGRPYLWVVRRDCRVSEGIEIVEEEINGMVVEWCSQVGVLAHPSVGCFVTHCGWNSTQESLVCGVPTVGVPQWTDQGTNAMLAEKLWGTGVRSVVNEDGVLQGEELSRCLDLVMGEGQRGVEIRRRAEMWKEKAQQALEQGGSSDRNLRAFVDGVMKSDV